MATESVLYGDDPVTEHTAASCIKQEPDTTIELSFSRHTELTRLRVAFYGGTTSVWNLGRWLTTLRQGRSWWPAIDVLFLVSWLLVLWCVTSLLARI